MKYFTKFLPVDGEIKTGDLTNKGLIREVLKVNKEAHPNTGCSVIYETDTFQRYLENQVYKVKLFLCSRDIQIGDRAMERLVTGEYEEFQIDTPNDIYQDMIADGGQFKVLGEISPGATWVREGDELEEGDLQTADGNLCFHYKDLGLASYSDTYYSKSHPYLKIRCPACHTFH